MPFLLGFGGWPPWGFGGLPPCFGFAGAGPRVSPGFVGAGPHAFPGLQGAGPRH